MTVVKEFHITQENCPSNSDGRKAGIITPIEHNTVVFVHAIIAAV